MQSRNTSNDISDGFVIIKELMNETSQYVREDSARLAIITTRLDILAQEVSRIITMLERGNGHTSIRDKIYDNLKRIEQIEKWQTIKGNYTMENIKGRWQVFTVAITALTALGLGILNWFKP